MEAWYHPYCMNDPQPEGHMASYIARREFLATLLGGAAAAWPLAVRAAVGDAALSSKSPSLFANRRAAFSQGLPKQAVEGQNVAIEYRWGDGQWPEIARPFARL